MKMKGLLQRIVSVIISIALFTIPAAAQSVKTNPALDEQVKKFLGGKRSLTARR